MFYCDCVYSALAFSIIMGGKNKVKYEQTPQTLSRSFATVIGKTWCKILKFFIIPAIALSTCIRTEAIFLVLTSSSRLTVVSLFHLGKVGYLE